MRRLLLWIAAIVLTAGVCIVAIDAVHRATTLKTFTKGMGTPDNPSHEEIRVAEWNLVYLIGFVAGIASGIGATLAVRLWLKLARRRV